MSRPKKMLPVLGKAPPEPEAVRDGAEGCTDDCCSGLRR
jgi:hypothetical protein